MSEKIIIDGVNVAGCEYYASDIDETCRELNGKYDVEVCDFCKCESVDNCYYKQLQRLKQENEELKEIIKTNNPWHKCKNCNKDYKQALEEINKIAIKEYHKKLEDKDCIECDESFLKIREFCDEVLND